MPLLGGSYRSCLLGNEMILMPGVMRASGDMGHFDECGRLMYDGRSDRQIKRLGHRINLDYIQRVREMLRLREGAVCMMLCFCCVR